MIIVTPEGGYMQIIEVDYTSAGVTQHLFVPTQFIYAYWQNEDDPTKTTVRHAANGTQIYTSVYDGTTADLTAVLTS